MLRHQIVAVNSAFVIARVSNQLAVNISSTMRSSRIVTAVLKDFINSQLLLTVVVWLVADCGLLTYQITKKIQAGGNASN